MKEQITIFFRKYPIALGSIAGILFFFGIKMIFSGNLLLGVLLTISVLLFEVYLYNLTKTVKLNKFKNQ